MPDPGSEEETHDFRKVSLYSPFWCVHEYLSPKHSGSFCCLPSHTRPCTQRLTKLFSNLTVLADFPCMLGLMPPLQPRTSPLDLHVTGYVSPSLSTTTHNPHWRHVFPFSFYKPRYFAGNISILVSVC